MANLGHYTQEYREHYEGGDWFERILIAARRRRVLHSLQRHKHAVILEVGCGLEPLFRYVHDSERFLVVEPSPDFADHARKLASARYDVEILHGYLEEHAHNLAAEPIDFIIAASLLHEVPDPEALLAAIRKIAKPSAVIHLNVPNVYSFHRLLALEMGITESVFAQSTRDARFERHTRFDKSKLLSLIDSAGFDVLKFETFFIKPFTNAQMAAAIDAGILDLEVLEALDRMSRHLPDIGSEMYAEIAPRE